MATAVLRSHDALENRMHLDAFAPSPSKPRRRRNPKPASAASSPPKAVILPAPRPVLASSPPAAAAVPGRRSPPARPVRKQPSPTKEKPKQQRLVMEEVRILKRGEEVPAPSPAPAPADQRVLFGTSRSAPAPTPAPAPAPVDRRLLSTASRPVPVLAPHPVDQRALFSTSQICRHEPAVVPTKSLTGYAGSAFLAAAPEPSSLPLPAYTWLVEAEATRGLRCLLRIGELS